MDLLLSLLVGLLCVLAGLLLAIVLVPFRLRAAGEVHDGEPSGAARVDWGLGLLCVEIDTGRRLTLRLLWLPVARFRLRPSGPGAAKRRALREKQEPEPERKGREGGLRRLRAALAERAAFRRMAGRLVAALHLRLRAVGRVGIGDPADTAVLAALLAALAGLPGVELEIGLDWVEEELELDLALSARVWVAELLAVAATLLLARPNRRALRVAFGRGRT